jgi:hypothetical protein
VPETREDLAVFLREAIAALGLEARWDGERALLPPDALRPGLPQEEGLVPAGPHASDPALLALADRVLREVPPVLHGTLTLRTDGVREALGGKLPGAGVVAGRGLVSETWIFAAFRVRTVTTAVEEDLCLRAVPLHGGEPLRAPARELLLLGTLRPAGPSIAPGARRMEEILAALAADVARGEAADRFRATADDLGRQHARERDRVNAYYDILDEETEEPDPADTRAPEEIRQELRREREELLAEIERKFGEGAITCDVTAESVLVCRVSHRVTGIVADGGTVPFSVAELLR